MGTLRTHVLRGGLNRRKGACTPAAPPAAHLPQPPGRRPDALHATKAKESESSYPCPASLMQGRK